MSSSKKEFLSVLGSILTIIVAIVTLTSMNNCGINPAYNNNPAATTPLVSSAKPTVSPYPSVSSATPASPSPSASAEPTVINLVDLMPFTAIDKDISSGNKSEASIDLYTKKISDNMGSSDYDTGFCFWTNKHSISEYTYILDRKYVKFTGVLAVQLDSKDRVDNEYSMVLTVYGDGKKLYTSKKLRGGVRPISYNIDISGVDELKLAVEMNSQELLFDSFKTLLLNPQLTSLS